MASRFASMRFFASLLAMLAVLSVADFVLTWNLLEREGSLVVESNPLAGRVLEAAGWLGLAAYKLILMTLIAVLALVIARRSLRSGELLLGFGCGAHAAVVITSTFLCIQPEGGENLVAVASTGDEEAPPMFPREAMAVLAQESVQHELQLTSAQVRHVREMQRLRKQLSKVARRLEVAEISLFMDRINLQESEFMAQLSPGQRSRLAQLCRQMRGPLAIGDEDVVAALGLNEEQSDRVVLLLDEHREARLQPSDKNVASSTEHTKQRLLAVLTPDQHARWQAMLGEPFPFDNRPAVVTVADADF